MRNLDEAIEEVRVQIKDGVDFIKIAMDGRQRNDRGEQVAAFNQAETEAIVGEVHRLGKKVAAHAWGKEATLYCARAKVDFIFHAFMMDDRVQLRDGVGQYRLVRPHVFDEEDLMSLSAAEKRLHPKLKFTPDAARSATLPAYYYYDPDMYEREKQEIFYKTWQYVSYVKDLQKAGDYITADIIDQKILVVRGKDDKLRAFYNVCMHRGHVLAEGKGNKTIFTCPFHAWSYDATGDLRAAGNGENVAGFELTDLHLSEVLVETFGGMVYVNLDPSAPTLHSMADGLEKEFETLVPRFHELIFALTDVFDIECNWKFVFDQMVCYHCPHIHPQILGRDDSYLEPSFDITAYDYWSQHFVAVIELWEEHFRH